ncbi:RNA polymerase-binding protein RbpA [Ornithinimicrobium sufpigmenti]|uniref:RNA polymerase-binding protein RbpA n=1 Tax=Ornithinimicrobium sufpigmenti TaxID=2508882 RepID=UPI0010364194|nr:MULTISPECIES: RNA polymerase-binding protein RbpA [unclassified Ornithinimicrobium]
MAGANAIRGSRVGSGPMGESERGEAAPRIFVSYWCGNGHETTPSFAQGTEVEIPQVWDCPRCGLPAGRDRDAPPEPPRTEPYKTHLAYVKERRSDQEGESLLEEALRTLRERGVGAGSSE